MTHFLTQGECESKPEIHIHLLRTSMRIRVLYYEFRLFQLKVNSILLNSASIFYLIFRHKTFQK